jgi:hypothetical protein
VNDTFINVGTGLVKRLGLGLVKRQRGHNTLRTAQPQRWLDSGRVESQSIFEGGRKIVCARRIGLLAWAALRRAHGVEEVVRSSGGRSRRSRRCGRRWS